MGYVVIHERDNVKVSLDNGHKYALRDIAAGEPVIKYGFPIGTAKKNITAGERVHTDNLKTALSGELSYKYTPSIPDIKAAEPAMINAYVRKNGDVGIRNDIWIVPTVGCVNGIAERLARRRARSASLIPMGAASSSATMRQRRRRFPRLSAIRTRAACSCSVSGARTTIYQNSKKSSAKLMNSVCAFSTARMLMMK